MTDAVDARARENSLKRHWCCQQKQVLRLCGFIRFANEPPALRMTLCWCRKTTAKSYNLSIPLSLTSPDFLADPRRNHGALRCDRRAVAAEQFQESETVLPALAGCKARGRQLL